MRFPLATALLRSWFDKTIVEVFLMRKIIIEISAVVIAFTDFFVLLYYCFKRRDFINFLLKIPWTN